MKKNKTRFRVSRIDGDKGEVALVGEFPSKKNANRAIKADSMRIIGELLREGLSGVPSMESTGPYVRFVPVSGHEFIYSVEMVY